MAICKFCGTEIADGSIFCPFCGKSQQEETTQETENVKTVYVQVPQCGMKWYNFLAYFALWASALLSLYSGADGIKVFTDSALRSVVDLLTEQYPLLPAYLVLLIIFSILDSILLIFTAVLLIKKKSNGPKALTICYVYSIVVNTICLIFSFGFPAEISNTGSFIISIFVGIIMILVNKTYFEHRADKFKN